MVHYGTSPAQVSVWNDDRDRSGAAQLNRAEPLTKDLRQAQALKKEAVVENAKETSARYATD